MEKILTVLKLYSELLFFSHHMQRWNLGITAVIWSKIWHKCKDDIAMILIKERVPLSQKLIYDMTVMSRSERTLCEFMR